MASVRRSGQDKKWRELASLLGAIFTPAAIANRVAEPHAPFGASAIPPPVPSPRQKLVLFTEHRDTLHYLEKTRITTLLGRKRGRGLYSRRHGPRGADEGAGGVQA